LAHWFLKITVHFAVVTLLILTGITTIIAAQDTTATTVAPLKARKANVQGPVKYWADHITFSIPNQTTHLRGNVKIEYENTVLTAGSVDIDWQRNLMIAKGIPDSTTQDSLGKPVMKDYPVLSEKGEEPIYGIQLEYDFKNNRGKVVQGRTKMQPGYYKGKDIRKIGSETLFIQDGYFTTCDLEDHPHFYFKSNQMRVRLNKVAVAKPVVLYIADVPIIGLPFAIFSLRRGRRSGIILPTYSESSRGGRALERFGYYWAPSEYWDFTLLNSFYEKTGFLFSGELNYNKRYAFNGEITGSYQPKDVQTGERKERWELGFNHNQTIGRTVTIYGNGRFASDSRFIRDSYSDFNQRINQTLTTNVSVRKMLPGSRTLSLNLRRVENLQTEQLDYTFPDLSYNQPTQSIFKASGSEQRWYHNLRYNYTSNLRNTVSRTPITDSTGTRIGFNRNERSGWQHAISPSFSTKLLRHFNFTSSLNFEELWVRQYLTYQYNDSTQTIEADTINDFRARHLITGIGANIRTTVYGLFEIPFSPLKVIRHKMDPTIGFSYSPDYTDRSFGYYQEIRDASGNLIAKRDRFANNAFGGTPGGGEQRNMNISLNNFFQGKIIRNGQEKKIDLFYLNFRTAYNFAADSLRWSNINTSFQAKPIRNLNISASATHSFYKKDFDGVGRRNKFVWADGFALPELLNWSTNMSYQLSLEPPVDNDAKTDTLSSESTNPFEPTTPTDFRYADFEPMKIPWRVNLNFNFSYGENNGRISRRFSTNISAEMALTNNWQIRYNAYVNVIDKDIVNQTFNINRDLHCWQMNFTWSPNRNFSYYRLEIRVKENLLRDLKLTKTAGSGGRPLIY
jgi:lipopolysaccharide assembly outer membrane protein LptD (OstA)